MNSNTAIIQRLAICALDMGPRWYRPLLRLLTVFARDITHTSDRVDLIAVRHAIAILTSPHDVYRICRRGVGTCHIEPWQSSSAATSTGASACLQQHLLAWFTPPVRWQLFLGVLQFTGLVYLICHPTTGILIAALPVLAFNSSTGSDTAASGAGPATALTGTNGSTAASTVVTLLVDNPDLSGVATDGSAVIWIKSSSGLQYSKITAVNNTAGVKTVTVATAYANTEGSRTWGIGGKRATLDHVDSRTLIQSDVKAGWTISLEDDQTITSTLTPTSGGAAGTGWILVKGNSVNRRTITCSANAASWTISSASANLWRYENVNFADSNGTKTSANAFNFSNSATVDFCWVNCATDSTNKQLRFILRSANTVGHYVLVGCDVNNTTGTEAISITSSTQYLSAFCCTFRNNAGHGLVIDSGYYVDFTGCVFAANAGHGVKLSESGTWLGFSSKFVANTFDGATGASSGIDASGIATNSLFVNNIIWANNIFSNNGTSGSAYGANVKSTAIQTPAYIGYNVYFGNRTSATLNWPTAGTTTLSGVNELTVDPGYTNASGGNFTVGTTVKALGFPDNVAATAQAPNATIAGVASGTPTYVDIGAAQRIEGSGALLTHPGMTGGMRG